LSETTRESPEKVKFYVSSFSTKSIIVFEKNIGKMPKVRFVFLKGGTK